MGEVDSLPGDKHKSFLQDDNITLGVLSQACPKNPIGLQYFCNKYVKENMKDQVDFLPAGKRRRLLQSDTIIVGVLWSGMPMLPKITSLPFLCNILRTK